MFLAASFCGLYFITGTLYGGLLGVFGWFLLPWVELLTRIRRMKMPLNNRLIHKVQPDESHFPHAEQATHAMEEEGFEHAEDCGWRWAGMEQFFRLYWNPEERSVAAVCLCEQEEVAFAFVAVTSRDEAGHIWRTTNFPFAPTLRTPSFIHWNHVPCEKNCFHQILIDHRKFLQRRGLGHDDLMVPDPDEIGREIEQEMKAHLDHNLEQGIIRLTGDGHFSYSPRGLVFLWGQFVKDMVRLC